MKNVILAAVAASLIACQPASAATDEACSQVTGIATTAFKARKEGATEDAALNILRQNKVYSGLPVWAVKQAFKAPIDTPDWVFQGFLFGECRKRAE